uniref:ferric-chelate reductase (NADPH) n=2 Tax=Moniliophthora roreri TaxID=221103 RepID=A0A0W0F9E4_MONRR
MSGLSASERAELVHDPYEKSPRYAQGVVYFICGGIALFTIARGILALRAKRRFSASAVKSSLYRKGVAAGRYLSSKQQRLSGIHFPVLGVGLLILAFFVFTMIWTWGTIPYYRSRWNVGSSPLAIRAGLLALGCFPFIFALATKWNIVTFITGHSHEKLQVYHQFMSHIFLLLSLIHSFPWCVQGMRELKPGFEPLTQLEWSWHVAHKVYYWSGTALLIILAWLCWASLPFIRRRYYETFKYLHVISALLFTGFFFVHCNKLLGSWNYLWATVVVYALCAGCRFVWMLIINGAGIPRASFELMPAGMVKLRVKCNPREVWGPGQHYFLHFMTVTPFQSHPFTIANLPSAENNELVVLVRQASGVTKRLAKHLGGKDADATIPVFLDGPFGGIHNDLSIYEHVVLIAGGTGITFIMPVLQDLIQKSKNEECVCKSIQVLWSVRDEESISWGITDLEKAVKEAPSSVVTVKIHVTGPSSNPDNESEKEKDPSGGALSYPLYGRADVAGFVSAAASDVRTMGVGACGPETLLYDVRNAVAKIQKDIALGKPGCSELFLHTEEYAW